MWPSGIETVVERDAPLAERTTFGIGGRAAFLLEPRTERALVEAYVDAVRTGLRVYVLGGGSNVLIPDKGVEGVVVCTRRVQDREPARSGRAVRVRAGTKLSALVRWAGQVGLGGLECLAGIPGTVGGAIRMNAGTRSGTVGSRVACVWCVARSGKVYGRAGREVRWAYRGTDIEDPVLAVELLLERDRPEAVFSRMAAQLSERRECHPVGERSAGCFYRNPPGVSAARLIDEAGLKGVRIGGAAVSRKHANFIVNKGGATAAHVMRLCKEVRRRVQVRFGLELESEVCCWPVSS